MSSGLLTDSERSSLYTLTVSSADVSSVGDGAVLSPGSQVDISVVKRSGASAPAALDFSLAASDGSAVSAMRFVSSSADSSKIKPAASVVAKSVSKIDGKLEGFSIPSDQAAGAYQLSVSVVGQDGSVLQQESISIFVGSAKPVIDAVSIYPPSIEPGASVLLGLSVSWKALASGDGSGSQTSVAEDPWIKWSRNGSTFAEGLQSAGFSKAVWTAPRAEGAYSVRAEVFPAAPTKGAGFSFKAAAIQDLRIMVISAPGGSGNDFADPLAFYSLLKLKGSFEDSGTRSKSSAPASFGSPALEAYPGGFGYRFGPSAGVEVPGLMPPSVSGKLSSFALLLRLSPDQASGRLVRFASADSSYVLSFGLDGGRPYVESQDGGRKQRSLAFSSIPQGPLTLEVVLRPEGDSLAVSWRAEGERIDAPPIPLPTAPPAGGATLGGSGSVGGVYDGFGLMAPSSSYSSYPSPALRLASRRQWKSSLVLAEGFEDGVMPTSASSSGSASVTYRGLALKGQASVSFSPVFASGSGLAVEVGVEGDRGSYLIEFLGADGKRAFAVRGTGGVLDASGNAIGSIPVSGTRTDFSLEQLDGRLCVVGSGGSPACAIPSAAERLTLAIRGGGEAAQAVVYRTVVRYSSSSAADR
jgi:hypothetical protein